MLNKKEIISIAVITLILGFTISLIKSVEIFLNSLLLVFSVIIINIFAKKITSFYLDSEIRIRMWEIKRYGFKPHMKLKKPFPAGAFFPVLFTAFSMGQITWLASLVFDIESKIHRAAKRHGIYQFSEIPEFHIGLIAASGIIINLIFAVVCYFINLPELAKLSIYYAFFNILPFSDLDGNKLFFGSLVLWSFLASITLIGLIFAVFVI